MTHPSEPAASELSRIDPGSVKALSDDDRRHLTRYLARHCAAGSFLDTCVEGMGPLPKLMDRFISHVVDTHRHLSGGTFVDAGEKLEVHPQSLRVLSRKVEGRPSDDGTLLTELPEALDDGRRRAIASALLSGNPRIHRETLHAALEPWTGPVEPATLEACIAQWLEEGLVTQEGDNLSRGPADMDLTVDSRARASVIAAQIVDHAAIYLSTPMSLPHQPRLARIIHSRGPLLASTFDTSAAETMAHLQETIDVVRRKWGSDRSNAETVVITLLMGPSSAGLKGYDIPERDIWLSALARHICRNGGLREAMPILYQEVARELRRRSVKRAYDVELLKAVGRARQNVHEWEAGRGFHFRGPAPLTVVDESPESLTAGHIRQYARVFLQERSQRACKIGEFLTWLQKEVGVKIEEQVLVQILEDEVAMGAARVIPGGSEPAYQAVRSFRRTWAQNVAQRRANLEMVIRSASGLVAGSAAGKPSFQDKLVMVNVRPGCAASFAADLFERSADFHAHMLGRHENLDPDHHEVLDVEVSMALSPTVAALGTWSSKK